MKELQYSAFLKVQRFLIHDNIETEIIDQVILEKK